MDKLPDIHKNRHSIFALKYCLVVTTKSCKPVLAGKVEKRLLELVHACLENQWECWVDSIICKQDYVQILFEAPPQIQLSALVGNFKTVTSRLLKKEFPELKSQLPDEMFWSRSYFIGSVGAVDETSVATYVAEQRIS